MGTLWHPAIKDDLLKFVMFAFPWGQPNTPIEHAEGPRTWQRDELNRISESILLNKECLRKGDPPRIYQSATCSGRGVGKSALVSWLSLWMLSCQIGSSTVITANTADQLTSRTFGEIGSWFSLFIANYWFDRNQRKISPAPWLAQAMKQERSIDSQYYYVDGVLWNEDNPHAFAGLHNPKGVMLIFDEASGIPQSIYTVSKYFFTEPSAYRFWLLFSNPRSNTGPFFECFHKFREYWYTRQLDSRTVEGTDKELFRQTIEQYGEDSDEARIEVKGQFPKQGDKQFISRAQAEEAMRRELDKYDDHAALVLGVDPARFGDDSTVIRFRRGRDARSIPAVKLKGADNMQVANKVAELIELHNPDAVFIDAGAGAGVIDRLRERGFQRIHEVWFGSSSEAPEYADHRTELWGRMRQWLTGAMLPSDSALADDLCGPEYEFQGREDKIKLESKEKMKKRGLSSPDNADALAVTFHAKVLRRARPGERPDGATRKSRKYRGADYKIFE